MTQPLPRGLLFGYGALGLPLAMVMLPVYILVPNIYAGLGLPLAVVGAVLLAARLFDAATDPLVGWLSDRTQRHRRKGWVLAGLPFTLTGAMLLLIPPSSPTAAYLLFASLTLFLGWTMVMLPYQALGAELSPDYHQRSRLAATREGLGLVGVILALVLPVVGQQLYGGEMTLTPIALAFLVLLPLATLWLLRRVPEPTSLPAPAPGWRQGWALLRANAPFQRLLAAYFLNGLANSLPATLFIYFVSDYLGSKDLAGPLLLLYFIAAILGLPFWLRLAAKGSKHTTWCWAMLWSCAFFLLAPLLQPGDLVPFAAICVLTGLALGADLALPPAMQADVVDKDSADGGNSRAGLYFALWGLVTKLTTALGVGLAFPILDWAGFSAMGNNSEGALSVLVVLYALVPVGLKLGAIFLMRNFPLTQEVQSALALRIQSKGN